MADAILRFKHEGNTSNPMVFTVTVERGGTMTAGPVTVEVSREQLQLLAELREELDELMPSCGSDSRLLLAAASALGEHLWQMIFQEGEGDRLAHDLWGQWQGEAPPERLLLFSDHPEPLLWPWEYLGKSLPTGGFFCPLADLGIRFIRCVPGAAPRPTPLPPSKLLVLASSPTDRVGFNTMWCDEQGHFLDAVLGPYGHVDTNCSAPTTDDFREATDDYDAIVFTGHAELASRQSTPSGVGYATCLYLVNATSTDSGLPGAELYSSALGGWLSSAKARTSLLVFNSCYSAFAALEILNVCAATGQARAPTILAMQFQWPVGEAFGLLRQLFSQGLGRAHTSLSRILANWRRQSHANGKVVFGVPTLFAPVPSSQHALSALAISERFLELALPLPRGQEPARLGLTDGQKALLTQFATSLLGAPLLPPLRAAIGSLAPARNYQPPDGLFMDLYPVTNHLYAHFARQTGRAFQATGGPDVPVEVTYNEATAFCQWAGGRLPGPEEWEYAARRGKPTVFPNCPDDLTRLAKLAQAPQYALQTAGSVFSQGEGKDWPCDMIGNVREFTSAVQGNMVSVKGGPLGFRLPWHAPSLTYRLDVQKARCGFRCVYD